MERMKKTIIVLVVVMLVGTIIAPSNVSAKTVYYGASHLKGKDTYRSGMVSKITLKKNKIVTKGSFVRASKESKLSNGKAKYYKNKKRTFKLSQNVKFFASGGMAGKQKMSKSEAKSYCNNPNGLYFILKVKNGKVVSVTFSS